MTDAMMKTLMGMVRRLMNEGMEMDKAIRLATDAYGCQGLAIHIRDILNG